MNRTVLVAAGVAVVIVVLVIGADLLRDLTSERAQLAREQRAREDRERARDRARAEYERDIGYIARIFDPVGLFT